MKIDKEKALKAVEIVWTMIDNLDFAGCLVDEEYKGFIEELTTITKYIQNEE
jgi:hypothetical protein